MAIITAMFLGGIGICALVIGAIIGVYIIAAILAALEKVLR